MTVLNAKKIRAALKKARNVGIVEDSVTIDGCAITLQNLAPEDYKKISQEVDSLETNIEVLNATMAAYLSRAIVEIDGVDLRDVTIVETEEEVADPENPGEVILVPIKLEKHEWLRKEYLSTWKIEAINVAFAKFNELLPLAEEKSKRGVKFTTPDETVEEKYRRHLAEAKELESNLPTELVKVILDEVGFIQKSTPQELAEASRRVQELADDGVDTDESTPVLVKAPSAPPVASPALTKPAPQVDMAKLMKDRQPLNQAPSVLRTPPSVPLAQPSPETRSSKIAALEASVDPQMVADLQAEETVPYNPQRETGEVKREPPIDPKATVGIIDRPPAAGINPRFRKNY